MRCYVKHAMTVIFCGEKAPTQRTGKLVFPAFRVPHSKFVCLWLLKCLISPVFNKLTQILITCHGTPILQGKGLIAFEDSIRRKTWLRGGALINFTLID